MRNALLTIILKVFGLAKSTVPGNRRGTILILIDGLSYGEFISAIDRGHCPFFRKLLKGSYRVKQYCCGVPAATTATEAELFFGNHDNIPGFTWYDRTLERVVRGNRGSDIEAFEKIYRKKAELLAGGSCLLGVYAAGATQMRLSGSDFDNRKPSKMASKLHILLVVLLNPLRLIYTVYLILKSILLSVINLIGNRSARSFRLSVADAFTHIFLGNIATYIAELELVRETPILFVDYLLYDEFAHEYGIENSATRSSIKLINWYCKSLYAISKKTKRKYDFFILSDHGQTLSRPFNGLLNGRLEELMSRATGTPAKDILKTLGPLPRTPSGSPMYLIPAGSTLQLYFSDHMNRPLYRDAILLRYPHIETVLLEDPQIGWLLTRISDSEQVLTGKSGEVRFHNGNVKSITGTPFGVMKLHNAVIASLARYATYRNNGDVVIFGNMDDHGYVTSFEDHKSTHGGFAGAMTEPFLMTNQKGVLAALEADAGMEKAFEAIRSTHGAS